MPDLLLVVLGVVVVVAVLLDAFMTTLGAAAGGGPLTRRLLGLCWRVLLRVHRRDARSSFLTAAGTVLLLVTVLIWMLLLWAGWTLAFLGSESVVEARTMAPASWSDVAYFTGTMIFTGPDG